MSMSRWDPFQDLLSFRDELNQTLNRWFGSEERQERTAAARRWTPVLDVVESKDAYRIDLEVPGVRPEDIEVTIDQGMLTIQGSAAPSRRPATAATTVSSAATGPSAAPSRSRPTSTSTGSKPTTTTASCG